jgi:hypothetical protein
VTVPPRVPRVYVAGPMRGIPNFNAPAFDQAATVLRELGYEVCNPLDRDRRYHGNRVTESATGDVEEVARKTGFNLRDALTWDMTYIAQQADAIAVLPWWEDSRGARAEVALAHALDIAVAPVDAFDAAHHGTPHATIPVDRLILPVEAPRGGWSTLTPPPSSAQRADAHDVEADREAGDAWRASLGETVLQEADRLVVDDRMLDYGHPLDNFTQTGRMWGALLNIDDVSPELVAMMMVAVKLSRETNVPKRDNRVDGAGYLKCLDMVIDERDRRAAS